MKILITGATGFIGSEVTLRLLLKGVEPERIFILGRKRPDLTSLLGLRMIREFARTDSPLSKREPEKLLARLSFVQADFERQEEFVAALSVLQQQQKTDSEKWRVLHLAALISTAHSSTTQALTLAEQKEIQLRVNLGSTRDLLEWSEQFADRFIFASSVVSFGATCEPLIRSEKDFPFFPDECRDIGYFTSKRQAHEHLLQAAKIPALIFCPGIVHGSYESRKSSRGHLTALRNRRLAWAPPGGGNFVGLDRVAESFANAVLDQAAKQSFTRLLVDENLDYTSYFNRYLDLYATHLKVPRSRFRRVKQVWPKAINLLLKILQSYPWILPKKRSQILESIGQSRLFLYFKSEFEQAPTRGIDWAIHEHFNTLD